MFQFDPLNGKVCLNSRMPATIRERLQRDPGFIEVLRKNQDAEPINQKRRFWCFPEFNEKIHEIDRSVTPKRTT